MFQNLTAMRNKVLLASILFLLMLFNPQLSAQVGVNTDNTQPDPSAMLDVKSTDKGMLVPRMTQSQIALIVAPANGLIVYCTTDDKFYAYVASANLWKEILYGSGIIVPPTIPIVTTTAVTNITSSTAITGGNVTNDGGAMVTERGVCWSTSLHPTTADIHTIDGNGTGEYVSNLTGLAGNTLYFVRAYATNGVGTAYGNEVSFTTDCSSYAPVSVVVTPSANPVCQGSSVTFTALPANAGSAPVYQWKVNGTVFGTNSTTVSYIPANNDVVTCLLTSNASCITGNPATSDALTMLVNLPPAAPAAGTHVPSLTQIVWNWETVYNASGYKWNTVNDFGSATDMGSLTAKTEAGLTCNTAYARFVWAYNACGNSLMTTLTNSTLTCATLPTVTTTLITDIMQTIATGGGTVTSDGGATVTTRGVCWSTNPDPTLSDSHTADGGGTGSFTSSLTGLTAATYYHVRAYATNSLGTSYGNEVTFFTLADLPTVTTNAVTNITQNTAMCGGNVISDGGAVVTGKGVCWSTMHNPTISDSRTNDGSDTGTFTSYLTGLSDNTQYYVRAYATNETGTSYGNEVSFNNTYYIGKNHGGGFIFYIDVTGQHGLIATPNDLGMAIWGCNTIFLGVTATAIGTGQANSAIISGSCGGGTAAKMCDDLVLDGYDDWFLPSLDELYQSGYVNYLIPNYTPSYYWTSSETSSCCATVYNFYGAYPFTGYWKNSDGYVRAIRAF